MSKPNLHFKTLNDLSLHDLEAIRLLLAGGSVIDWQRLNFTDNHSVDEFLKCQAFEMSEARDRARTESIKENAIRYLEKNFEFPVPKPVAQSSIEDLLLMASGKGHRQMCACTILKVMHIIHHLEARELMFMLSISDLEVFQMVEKKVYKVIGDLLSQGLPILEIVGGRKNKDSLYTKLLHKRETHAAQIYDKLRFRIVTRHKDDILPVVTHLMREVFAFNYIVPQESTNTMFPLKAYCDSVPHLSALYPKMQPSVDADDVFADNQVDNRFTSNKYRVVHFVVDLPLRLPNEILEEAPPAAHALGSVVFGQTEFQVIDRETEQKNELGDASHDAYKKRQMLAVKRRLQMGTQHERVKAEEIAENRASRLPPKKR